MLGTIVSIRHDYFVSAGVGIVLDGLIDVEEERILHVGEDHADCAALAAGEVARMQIGVIPKFFDGFQNARARGGFDDACVIQHPGHGRSGDFGAASDLFQIHELSL